MLQTSIVAEEKAPEAKVSRRAGALRILALDIVGPLVVYRVCRGVGVAEVWALVLSGLPPGIGVLADWLRWRTLEVVGAVVLAGIGLSIVLALVTNNTKIVLLEDAGLTAAFGLACLGSLATKRPLIFYFGQGFYGGRNSADGAGDGHRLRPLPEKRGSSGAPSQQCGALRTSRWRWRSRSSFKRSRLEPRSASTASFRGCSPASCWHGASGGANA